MFQCTPVYDPTYLLFLIESDLLPCYVASNYLLPVLPHEPLTLPIEVHLDLIKPEAAAERQKLIMLGPANMPIETPASTNASGTDSHTMNDYMNFGSPLNFENLEMPQQPEQPEQPSHPQQPQQPHQCNNGMHFHQAMHPPHAQAFVHGGYMPAGNVYQQQAAAHHYVPPPMQNLGFPLPQYPFGPQAMPQQPPPLGSQPNIFPNPNELIYVAMHSRAFYEFLFKCIQQLFVQFAPFFQQQQQQQQQETQQQQESQQQQENQQQQVAEDNSTEPYGVNTEPISPLINE